MVNDKEQAMYTAQEQNLIDRANHMGKNAVGESFTIKLADKGRANKVTVSGEIVECGFGYFSRTSSALQAVFKVVILCGPNKVRREFHVLRVPQ
jgi:hypothetical protein